MDYESDCNPKLLAGHADLTALHLGSSIFAHQLPATGVEALAVLAPLGSGVGLPTPHLKVLYPAGVKLVLRQLEGVYFCHLHCICTWHGKQRKAVSQSDD